MKTFISIITIFLFAASTAFTQSGLPVKKEVEINRLLDSLWQNPTSFFNKTDHNWRMLCSDLQHIDLAKLNQIKDSVFLSKKSKIKNKSTANTGFIGFLNKRSQNNKSNIFSEKMHNGFISKKTQSKNKIVLVEGDSWFEYPLFLRDITDNLVDEKNLAVYSLASGGDWVANMISGGEYQQEYLALKPDVFILSGGGNDIVDNDGITHFVTNQPIASNSSFLKDYKEYVILRLNHKPVPMCTSGFCPIEYHLFQDSIQSYSDNIDTATVNKIVNGRRYLTKNFFRWLVTFKLEDKLLFESIHKLDSVHFKTLKIITQGYDYAIPSDTKKFGIRLFTGNGQWLKHPLEKAGITDAYTQQSIVMALMFDFNEMLIELGKEYGNIYHVDVRGFTRFLEEHDHQPQGSYWFDELHPVNRVFEKIAGVYITIINNKTADKQRVYSVVDFYRDEKK